MGVWVSAVIHRCLGERQEEAETPCRSEPWRTIFHGVPGAGKTQTLKWLRQFFETICEWTHPQEFVHLAPQHTQAALIAGMTLHSFANIRINTQNASQARTHGPEQFVQYQRLRWIVLDECSTTGLEVLATLEKRLTQATRAKGTWKPIRSNKTGNLNMSTLVVANVQTFFISTLIPWEMIQFNLTNIFQMG